MQIAKCNESMFYCSFNKQHAIYSELTQFELGNPCDEQ